MKYLPILALTLLSAAACTTKKDTTAVPALTQAPQGPVIGGGTQALPKAVVYKMSGDYAENVPVQVNPQGDITSFPAPTDVRGQQPVKLIDGWYLDRRGIGPNSVFTTYTYAEYSKLPSTPTLKELKAAIIPGARVTDCRQLPMTASEAAADTAAVIESLKNLK